jgi:hypothetical protein
MMMFRGRGARRLWLVVPFGLLAATGLLILALSP